MEAKRAVLYARVSSDDNKKDGRNLNGQIEMCRQHAKKKAGLSFLNWLRTTEARAGLVGSAPIKPNPEDG